MTRYLTACTWWSVAGLLLGYTVGLLHAHHQPREKNTMTTAERFRRRQRIEGALLVILGIFTVCITLYFHGSDNRQRDCVASKFTALSVALNVRGELTTRDADNTSQVIRRVARAQTPGQAHRALDHYLDEYRQVRRERARNPLPPFPAGTCDQ